MRKLIDGLNNKILPLKNEATQNYYILNGFNFDITKPLNNPHFNQGQNPYFNVFQNISTYIP
ncbi:MAG: hypothetical protein WCP85_21740 [Mariniphaga sp.]